MDGNSDLKIAIPAKADFNIDKDATITNMDATGGSSAWIDINGGTTVIAGGKYTENLGVNLLIGSSATLNNQGQTTLTLTGDYLYIDVLGKMDVNPSSGGMKLIDRGANTHDIIDVTGGTLTYLETAGVKDTFNIPVRVQQGGAFIVSSNQLQTGNAKLIVTGSTQITLNRSVYLTGTGSTVQLSQGTILECDNDYYQDGGTLETMDTSKCTLWDGANGLGTATIVGGSVKINQPNTGGYGELDVQAQTLNFGAQLVVAINGTKGGPGQSDLLSVVGGTINLNAGNGSTLTVYINNPPPQPKTQWTIIDTANLIQGNFAMPITTVPQSNVKALVDPLVPSNYIIMT